MTTHTGGCLCGTITYAITGDLGDGMSCHCSVCRKAFNGAGSAVCWIDPDSFSWTKGEEGLSTYTNKQGFSLGFCRTCGTTLCVLRDGKVLLVTLGSLDGNPPVRIGQHVFVGSKADWDEIGGDAPQFEERPAAAGA